MCAHCEHYFPFIFQCDLDIARVAPLGMGGRMG